MTKQIVPRSKGLNCVQQEDLVQERGHQRPHLVDAVTSILLEYIRSGQCFFTENPERFTRCKERLPEGHESVTVVGTFGPPGNFSVDAAYDNEPQGTAAVLPL